MLIAHLRTEGAVRQEEAVFLGERCLFETVRLHNGPEIVSLWDYRNRYALYKSAPDL